MHIHRRAGACAAVGLAAQTVVHTLLLHLVAEADRAFAAGAFFLAGAAGITGALRACVSDGQHSLASAARRHAPGVILGLAVGIGPVPLRAFGWALVLGLTSSLFFVDLLVPRLVKRWHSTSGT
jgi:hypothetical protein